MKNELPTILIDADACPVTAEALQLARKNALPVLIVGNTTQKIARHIRRSDPTQPTQGFWVDLLQVGVGADSADFALVEQLKPNDIVVTQDIGLAAMVLGRSAFAIGVRGREYLLATIDFDMEMRHIEKKVRRQGGRTKGPAPFSEEDREHFVENLQRIIERALREQQNQQEQQEQQTSQTSQTSQTQQNQQEHSHP
jgi:uncharacterized protein YaiI (UPF0178 family)